MITDNKKLAVGDLLVLAKSKIDQPEKWTKGASARDENRVVCRPGSEGAVCFCSAGALGLASDLLEGVHEADLFLAAAKLVADSLPTEDQGFSYLRYNDKPETTHEDVMALFGRAIKKARASQ